MNDRDGVLAVAVADVTIHVRGLWPELLAAAVARYAAFASDRAPALSLDVTPSAPGRAALDDGARVEHLGERRFTISYGLLTAELSLANGSGHARLPDSIHILDSLLRISVTLLLGEREGLLLHAAGIVAGDDAIVCFGPSGVGKTTVARSVAPADVLCDEMIALRFVDGGVRAWGTPFHGELPLTSPRALPLGALVRLQQSPDERVAPLSPAAGARALLGAMLFFCRDEALVERALELCSRLSARGVLMVQFRKSTDVRQTVLDHLRDHAIEAGAKAAGPSSRR